MTYAYDILVNFIDSNRIYEVFEWNNNDDIEHIKRIPLFLVDYKTIDDLLNNDIEVSKKFLDIIKDKTILFSNNEKNIEYSSLLTEGNRVYAFLFNKEGSVEYKSSLLLDEEQEILELSMQLDNYKIEYTIINDKKDRLYLTRKEEKNRNYIIKDLKYSYKSRKYEKIKYLYNECFNEDKTSNKEKLERLINDLDKINSPVRNKLNYILKLSYNSTCK